MLVWTEGTTGVERLVRQGSSQVEIYINETFTLRGTDDEHPALYTFDTKPELAHGTWTESSSYLSRLANINTCLEEEVQHRLGNGQDTAEAWFETMTSKTAKIEKDWCRGVISLRHNGSWQSLDAELQLLRHFGCHIAVQGMFLPVVITDWTPLTEETCLVNFSEGRYEECYPYEKLQQSLGKPLEELYRDPKHVAPPQTGVAPARKFGIST